MKTKLFAIITAIITLNASGQDLGMKISGDANFDNSQLALTEAGDDFPSSFESDTYLFLRIHYVGFWWGEAGYLTYYYLPDKEWHISVSKEDITWNDDLILEARRTGDGNRIYPATAQPLFIEGGDSYQEISNNVNFLFRGRHGIENIPVQLKIRGASLTMGAETYQTKITFTVYDDGGGGGGGDD